MSAARRPDGLGGLGSEVCNWTSATTGRSCRPNIRTSLSTLAVSRAFRCSVRARIQCANKPLPSERLASRLARRCRVLCPSAHGEAAKNRLPAVDTCATSNFRADCYLPFAGLRPRRARREGLGAEA